jgi:hypothetical protein
VLSFGEDQIMMNLPLPRLQAQTRHLFGFGYPFYPLGRWYSPIPAREPLTIVVGHPISVEPYLDTLDPVTGEPPAELVKRVHTQYYEQLALLFEKHKADAGFENCVLSFSDD